jgi:hypothetical protein
MPIGISAQMFNLRRIPVALAFYRTPPDAGVRRRPVLRVCSAGDGFWFCRQKIGDGRAPIKIYGIIICIMVDVMYETPERDVFY